MIRNLKALGLALVAVFAMSAIAASAAQAEKADFWAEEANAKIDAVGETVQTFVSPSGLSLTCATVNGKATLATEGPTLTGTNIAYTTCHVVVLGITFPITVDMNSCDYEFTAGTMTSPTTAEGSVEIKCGGSDQITITIFKAGSVGHPVADLRCTIHVPPQKPSAGAITYHNITKNNKMAVTVTAKDIKVSTTKTNAMTSICNSHVTETDVYNGSFVASATNGNEEFIDTTVTGTK